MLSESHRYRQFQLRHLLGITAGAAVLCAVLAPLFRGLDTAAQVTAVVKTGTVLAAALCIVVYLMFKRASVERDAGPLIEHFERRASRIRYWLAASALWILSLAEVVIDLISENRISILPGSPVMLFFAVNYVVVRGWWRVDPTGLEVRQNGLVLGGIQFRTWDDIARYSWSGTPTNQLNLFFKERCVLNLKIDASFVERLDPMLAEHTPPRHRRVRSG